MATWIKTIPDPGGLSDYVQISAIQNVGVRPHINNAGVNDGTFDLVVYVAGGSTFVVKLGYNSLSAAQAALDTDIASAGGAVIL